MAYPSIQVHLAVSGSETLWSRGGHHAHDVNDQLPRVVRHVAPVATRQESLWTCPSIQTPPAPSPVGAPSTAAPVAPTAPTNPATSFNIDIQFIGDPSSDKDFFTAATRKWQSVITGDLPDFNAAGFTSKEPGCVYPALVDDLFICCVYKAIDGNQGIVGIAGPNVNRPDGTATLGTMTFDEADIQLLKASKSLTDTILHEMGHIFGLGIYWDDRNVAGLKANGCPYIGPNANREYKAVSNCNAVPLEKEEAKGACSHWDEECLVNEIMTGVLLRGSTPILSRITVGSLDDLGYEVSYSAAEPYTSANIGPGCSCRRREMRSMTEMNHGETIALGNLRGVENSNSSAQVSPYRRPISPKAHERAVAYGKSVLAERAAAYETEDRKLLEKANGVYVGDQVVSVLIYDEGEIYGVIVHK